jgi:ABC-2 type transport system ATP-binding protein
MIKLVKLTKKFHNITAVDHINLEVKSGSIMGFLGPNGAGKTTTIKLIAGVLKPSSGTIILDNIDLLKYPTKAKAILGYIPDRPFIYEKLTGYEFLQFIASLYGIDPFEIKTRILELLNRFDLLDFKDELIETYSHGMKQRLVMCSALVHDPKILIIDEPIVGLDPRGIKMVKELFKNYASKGKTIFVSTHSLDIAEAISDEIAIIDKGKIIAIGTIKELEERAGAEGKLEDVFFKLTSNH